MTWLKPLALALLALTIVSSPAYAGKKHAKAPSPNGGIYQAPVPRDNPGRITEIRPPTLSTDPGAPIAAPHSVAAAAAPPDLEPAPEPRHFAIAEMRLPSLFP